MHDSDMCDHFSTFYLGTQDCVRRGCRDGIGYSSEETERALERGVAAVHDAFRRKLTECSAPCGTRLSAERPF